MRRPKFFSFSLNEPKKIAAMLISILAAILFFWEMVINFYSANLPKSVRPLANQASPQLLHLSNNSALFMKSLFGDYVPVNLAGAEIKQSMLAVEIVGIMCADKEGESHAVIRTGTEIEKTYMVGDSLSDDAVIKRILPQSVVILHEGILESLSLPKNALSFETPAKPLIEE